jgi:hypothetical protein
MTSEVHKIWVMWQEDLHYRTPPGMRVVSSWVMIPSFACIADAMGFSTHPQIMTNEQMRIVTDLSCGHVVETSNDIVTTRFAIREHSIEKPDLDEEDDNDE